MVCEKPREKGGKGDGKNEIIRRKGDESHLRSKYPPQEEEDTGDNNNNTHDISQTLWERPPGYAP